MTKRAAERNEQARQEMIAVADDQRRERVLHPREGEWYTVVTAAPIYHGRLVAMTPLFLILDQASWVVETGRLNEYVKDPGATATEAEYVGEVVINLGSVMGLYPVPSGQVSTR